MLNKSSQNEKILLFAFRKSHKSFFKNIINKSKDNLCHIIASRDIIFPRFNGVKNLKNIDFKPACNFAIDEFIAKTGLNIPRILLNSFFKPMAYINYFRYYEPMTHGYTKMLIWNGGKFRQRIAIEIANVLNIKVYYYENGLLPNRIVFDDKGINYENSVPRNKDFYEKYHNDNELPKELIPRVSKHIKKFNGSKIVLPENFIFVPFQVDYDTQIITNSNWIKNMRMLFDLIEDVAKQSDKYFVLKEHPSSGINYPDLHKRVDKINNISFANSYATQDLIEKSDAVITINSTVGVESLLFHKKVIVLGDAFYSIDDISFGVKNKDVLIKTINNIDKLNINIKLIDNLLKYLYYDYLIVNDESVFKILYDKLIKKEKNNEK